jgi:hypothetical protein
MLVPETELASLVVRDRCSAPIRSAGRVRGGKPSEGSRRLLWYLWGPGVMVPDGDFAAHLP